MCANRERRETRIAQPKISDDVCDEKWRAHQFLDRLDAGQFSAVVHLLQLMTSVPSSSLASETGKKKKRSGQARRHSTERPRFARA